MAEETKLPKSDSPAPELGSSALFAFVRSKWFLRWHITHLVWVLSAVPLLVLAGWKALAERDLAWTAFVWGWIGAGIWLRVDSFLTSRCDVVRQRLANELEELKVAEDEANTDYPEALSR